jgi:hypothetical protein
MRLVWPTDRKTNPKISPPNGVSPGRRYPGAVGECRHPYTHTDRPATRYGPSGSTQEDPLLPPGREPSGHQVRTVWLDTRRPTPAARSRTVLAATESPTERNTSSVISVQIIANTLFGDSAGDKAF